MEKPQFSEAQLKESTEFMRTNLRGKYDYKETSQAVSDYQAPSYAPQYVYAAGQQKKTEEDMVTQWMNIYTAKTAADKDAAAENLLGTLQNMNAGVIDVDPTATGVIIKYADGRSIPIEYAQGGAGNTAYKSGDQWAAAGRILHGVGDQNMYNKYKNSTFSNLADANEWNNVGAAYSMPAATDNTSNQTSVAAFNRYVDDKAGSVTELFGRTEGDAVPNLAAIFANTGFTFEEAGAGTDKVTVIAPDGTTKKTFELDITDAGERVPEVEALKAFMKANATVVSSSNWNSSSSQQGVGANYNPKPE
jgi:hypothetical protein